MVLRTILCQVHSWHSFHLFWWIRLGRSSTAITSTFSFSSSFWISFLRVPWWFSISSSSLEVGKRGNWRKTGRASWVSFLPCMLLPFSSSFPFRSSLLEEPSRRFSFPWKDVSIYFRVPCVWMGIPLEDNGSRDEILSECPWLSTRLPSWGTKH